jgi:membrane fusion protein (multidrug efflux system)
VPVKIVLSADDVRKLGGRLVPGMSALAEIRLNQTAAAH